MSKDTIDTILQQRKAQETGSSTTEVEENKFYSAILGEGMTENFLEIRFRDGLCTCFSYTDLVWFNFDPEGGFLDLEFGGFLVTIKGRGLGDRFFYQLKGKRVSWVKEADSDFQDHDGNDIYVSEITITPPEGFPDDEEEGGQ